MKNNKQLLKMVHRNYHWRVMIFLRNYYFEGFYEARRFAIYWDVDFPKMVKKLT